MDTNRIQTLLSFYQVLQENPAFPDATFWMWFDAPVVIRGTAGFLLRYVQARLNGLRLSRQPAKLPSTPEVTWFVTTRDLPGPLLHTLSTGIANTRYPNLRIVILDCGHGQPAQKIVDRIGDARISVVTAARSQPEWYRWLCSHVTSDYFVVTHDDLHFVAPDWIADIVQPMICDPTIGCVCGEAFPVRLDTVEPGGTRVDIANGLSTWMWAARRDAVVNRNCDFSFAKRGVGASGRMEVWDQGGLWLENMAITGWRVTYESPSECLKWQHFENFDWTRESGDRRYASLKRLQRSIITALAEVHLVAIKVRRRV